MTIYNYMIQRVQEGYIKDLNLKVKSHEDRIANLENLIKNMLKK